MGLFKKIKEQYFLSEYRKLEKQEYIWQEELILELSDNDYCNEQLKIIREQKEKIFNKIPLNKQKKYSI